MKRDKAAQAAIKTRAHILIIEARFYAELCDELAKGAIAAIERAGATWERHAVPGALETGPRQDKVAGNCHLRFPGVESEALLVLLDEAGVFASAGSACASGAMEPSHVLVAMGLGAGEASSSVRLSLGAGSTEEDVDLALEVVPKAVADLRG